MATENTASGQQRRLGAFPYVLGGLSFIPLIGVIFGIVSIIWGVRSKSIGGRKLAVIGASGIAVTVLLYGGLFYFGFVQRGGIYDGLRTQLAQAQLNTLVQSIEFYKVQHGAYPESLEEVRRSLPKASFVSVYDPTQSGPSYFYYERVDADHYYLRGVGRDGKPFTADDIVPQIDTASAGKLGLLLEAPMKTPASKQ